MIKPTNPKSRGLACDVVESFIRPFMCIVNHYAGDESQFHGNFERFSTIVVIEEHPHSLWHAYLADHSLVHS